MNKKKVECQRCGMCCMVCDMEWEEVTTKNRVAIIDRLRWLSLHRVDTMIVTRKDEKKVSVMRIPLTCKLVAQDDKGKFYCKDYEHRPNVCRNFLCPRAKGEVLPDNKQT